MINIKCAAMTALSICNAQQQHCSNEDLKMPYICLAGICIVRCCKYYSNARTMKKDHVRQG